MKILKTYQQLFESKEIDLSDLLGKIHFIHASSNITIGLIDELPTSEKLYDSSNILVDYIDLNEFPFVMPLTLEMLYPLTRSMIKMSFIHQKNYLI